MTGSSGLPFVMSTDPPPINSTFWGSKNYTNASNEWGGHGKASVWADGTFSKRVFTLNLLIPENVRKIFGSVNFAPKYFGVLLGPQTYKIRFFKNL